MFTPNPKRTPEKTLSPAARRRLVIVLILTTLLLALYYGALALGLIREVMIVYFVAFGILLVGYLAYNRGFVNKDVTEDDLPADWPAEKKRAFVEGNHRRAEKSRWMVTLIIPFVLVFMAEALYLFVWDPYIKPFIDKL